MSSSGRTPLPEIRPTSTATNANMGPGPGSKRLTPVKSEDIDHTQVPVIASADGVILTNGKFRCNMCGSHMMNKAVNIRSHNAKFHPKDPSKISAYMRRIARIPTPCGECGKICVNNEMLVKHIRLVHRRAEQSG
ncbi:hypothetical protein F5B21DRAFT_185082 [Xylaria acuta]|nr:hypothetical protein F5B21DRAFT_185082 [Xylaria acuta]